METRILQKDRQTDMCIEQGGEGNAHQSAACMRLCYAPLKRSTYWVRNIVG